MSIFSLLWKGKKCQARNYIFSTLGKYIYRGVIKLEKGYSIIKLDFKNKNFVVFVEDSNGERKLIKYKINTPQL